MCSGEALQLESFRGGGDVSGVGGASPHSHPLRSLSAWFYSDLMLACSTMEYIYNENSHKNKSNLKEKDKFMERIFI